MIIPLTEPEASSGQSGWTTLDSAGKRERLLVAATEVFARDGLDAPMSAVADAAGAGVASVYRLFESKRELLAALVVRRMDTVAAAAQAAFEQPGGGSDLVGASKVAGVLAAGRVLLIGHGGSMPCLYWSRTRLLGLAWSFMLPACIH